MADTAAVRARRARKHKQGDHRMCKQDRCEQASAVGTATDSPTKSGTRGGRLWAEMHEGRGLSPTHRVLLEESCRVADRLDKLDAMLRDGRDWLVFEVSDDGTEVRVTIDRLLSEARMQETAFKGMVAELRQATEPSADVPAAPVTAPTPTAGGGSVVNLRAAVAAKRAQAAG